MSLTTTAPLNLPERQSSMSYPADRDFASPSAPGAGPGPAAYYSRPPSSHGASSHSFTHPDAQSSPDRNGSSHSQGFTKTLTGTTPQTPAYPSQPHGYPATPISGPSYPTGSYYGITHSHSQSQDGDHDSNAPSPPHSAGRSAPPNFTQDGNPLVPVGISGGKMFQCRGYGQCDKVFTRSEHLARHVRKHTGERPFPCHCGKSFSRLDNLRQHASTVHNDQAQLNNAMLDSLTPVHSALSARATREQRKRGEIVEVPKNAVERPRHGGHQRNSNDGSATPTVVTAAAYPPYADEGAAGWDEVVNRPRASTGGAYDYHQQGVEVLSAPGVDSTPGPGPSRRPGSSAGGYPGYPTGYYDGLSNRPPTGDASSAKPIHPIGYGYRSMSTGGRDPTHGHYAESEPPTSAHGLPESPMYTAPPPVPQPNWSSPPPHSAYGHEHRTFYHPTPTPEGYSYPEPSHTSNTVYGPPPPGSSGSAYGYPGAPGAPPTPANPSYFGASHHYHAPHGNGHPQPGYAMGAYGPGNAASPFQFHGPPGPPGPAASSTPLTASTSLPIVPTDYQYPPNPSPTTTTSLKRRLDEASDDTATSPVNITSSAQQFNSRKVPRSSLSHSTQPIRALQEHNPPGQDDDDQLWFPPTTERRSSLAISALLGSPQADHKPRAPWDGSGTAVNVTGSVTEHAAGTVTETGTGDMEEKAKALLGSAH